MRTALPVTIVALVLAFFVIDSYRRAKLVERLEYKVQKLEYAASQK